MAASGGPAEIQKACLLSWVSDRTVILLFCVLFLTQTVLSLRQKSATWDETVFLPAGYLYLKFGDYAFEKTHPPLVKMLAAVPLLFLDVRVPTQVGPFTRWKEYEFGHHLLYEANDADRLLLFGRLAVLPLALLLGFVIFLWAKEVFGRDAAIFALFLYSFEPNILAHSGLVTTDLGVTCFIFITVYSCYRLLQQVSIARLVFAGFALGLSFVTKFSAAILIPTLLLLGVCGVISRQPLELPLAGVRRAPVSIRSRKLLFVLAALIVMTLIAYGTIWLAYRVSYEGGGLSGQRYLVESRHIVARNPWIKQATRWTEAIKPLPKAFIYGFGAIFTSLGRPSFLMGEYSSEGWWYYFIVSFLIKTPLPLLLFLSLTPIALRRPWRENPMGILFLVVPALLYFGVASVARINIGHRHLLPIYPFLIVIASSLLPWVLRQGKMMKWALVVLSSWFVLSSVSIFPHYLAYFNELVGGPDNGYKYLVDSNLDWGQDLKGLKRYMDGHGIQRAWLSYFGTASPDYYGIAYNYLPSHVIFRPSPERKQTPYVAISATNLQGVYFPAHGLRSDYFEQFKKRQPIAKIGYSIFLYRLD